MKKTLSHLCMSFIACASFAGNNGSPTLNEVVVWQGEQNTIMFSSTLRFSDFEGSLPTLSDETYDSMVGKTVYIDVKDIENGSSDIRVTNGWWAPLYYEINVTEDVFGEGNTFSFEFTAEMAYDCKKGGAGRDLMILSYSNSFTMTKFYYFTETFADFSTGNTNLENSPVMMNQSDVISVPAEFSSKGQEEIWFVSVDDNNGFVCSLVDEDLNEMKRIASDEYIDLLSQTLFNTDEEFEYITPVRSLIYENRVAGFNIVSESELLQTVIFPDEMFSSGLYAGILKIGKKLYLMINGVAGAKGYYNLYYRINPASSSVTMVRQDYVGKIRKVYDRGRFFIKSAEGKRYTIDGVETVRE